jgi:hypothetical protein
MTINKESPTGFTNVLISDNVGATLTRNPAVTGPQVDAALEIQSSDGALLLPRMTAAQRDALNPTNGMLVYVTVDGVTPVNAVFSYEDGVWVELASGAGSGDVDGPASSITDHIATYADLTGKVIKDSGALLTSSPTFAIREDGVGGRLLIGSNTGTLAVGTDNIGIGYNTFALNAMVTGVSNIAIGRDALSDVTSGTRNVSIGRSTLDDNASGNDNVAVGNDALRVNTVSGNTAVGSGALDANTIGIENVALGNAALGANIDAGGNTAIGFQSMLSTNTLAADSNTAVGGRSLRENLTGNQNVAVGYGAMLSNQSGGSNVAVGAGALSASQATSSNTVVGFGGLAQLTTGDNNTSVGETTGNTHIEYNSCTLIGQNTSGAVSGLTNSTALGADAVFPDNNTIALGDGCGVVLTNAITAVTPPSTSSLLYRSLTTEALTVLSGDNARRNGALVNAATIGFSVAPTAGIGTITNPNTSLVIMNTAATADSIILVTLIRSIEPLQPVAANVTNALTGEITIFLDTAPTNPLSFQWFIINPAV